MNYRYFDHILIQQAALPWGQPGPGSPDNEQAPPHGTAVALVESRWKAGQA
jgi:hypothetical protein